MKSFQVFLMREENGVLYREASVALHNLVPAQFNMHSHATLSVEQALSLLKIAGKGALGKVRLRVNLETCEEIPPHPDASPSQAPESDKGVRAHNDHMTL